MDETYPKRLQTLVERSNQSNADLQTEIAAIMREAQNEFNKRLLAQGDAKLAELRKKMI